MATSALASCLANGLGALCDRTATPAFRYSAGFGAAMGLGQGLGSAASSLYGSSASSSREPSIGSLGSMDFGEMLAALSGELLDADSDSCCHSCEAGIPAARCTQCNQVSWFSRLHKLDGCHWRNS